ncbi:MAG: hypothetical protein K8U57_27430 [Planctomycetes bacterium]|nr:hypothetical protein [Planctomycetota bacterium]
MTRTFHTSLGASPLTGKQGIDQAARFKQQLRSIYEKPTTVSLLTVTHVTPPHMEVVAQHDADDPVASAWVRHAVERAPEIWQKLAERRTAVRGR